MATQTDYERLRRDVGASIASLPDAEADALFIEAGEKYSDPASQTAYTRVLALRGILADSAKLASYRQNESQESLSDIYKNLRDLLNYWQAQCDGETAQAGGGSVRFGRTTTKPARIKEYPDSAGPTGWS